MRMIDTTNFSQKEIMNYYDDLIEAFDRQAEQFPADLTREYIIKNILEGIYKLWLILDEEDNFLAFLLSELEISTNGKKRVLASHLAAKKGKEFNIQELVNTGLHGIEEYAKIIGADSVALYGRNGWSKFIKKYDSSYHSPFAKFEKDL